MDPTPVRWWLIYNQLKCPVCGAGEYDEDEGTSSGGLQPLDFVTMKSERDRLFSTSPFNPIMARIRCQCCGYIMFADFDEILRWDARGGPG